MKNRRWMTSIVKEAKKIDTQATLVWTRQNRRKRGLAKPAEVNAAE